MTDARQPSTSTHATLPARPSEILGAPDRHIRKACGRKYNRFFGKMCSSRIYLERTGRECAVPSGGMALPSTAALNRSSAAVLVRVHEPPIAIVGEPHNPPEHQRRAANFKYIYFPFFFFLGWGEESWHARWWFHTRCTANPPLRTLAGKLSYEARWCATHPLHRKQMDAAPQHCCRSKHTATMSCIDSRQDSMAVGRWRKNSHFHI